MEFHISRQARDRYSFSEMLFALKGNVIFANFQAARLFAQKINQQLDLVNYPERAVQAGEVNAMGLIDEILHMVIAIYRQKANPEVFADALAWLKSRFGVHVVEQTFMEFIADFPPVAVYRGESSPSEYLARSTDGTPNEEVVLEEMLMLWLDNKNPAFILRDELFNDSRLVSESSYAQLLAELYRFFDTQPRFGDNNQNLIDLLRAPAVASPHSLFAQLDFIREHWADLLGDRFADLLRRLMASLDLIREEQAQRGFFGPGPIEVPRYDTGMGAQAEVENFSPDREWMPRLVLLAKNTYVWLDQLSQAYQRKISRLDEIPDDELAKLASWGFTGLWLIGLWERSRASARIKQMMGNPEAIASAYSLFDYRIAGDLGGEAAYQSLRERAWRYGIRLASDMVPNHMGIDSPWVAEHPDWFLSLDYSPYPAYTFNSPDLSADPRVSIHLEDHYFTRSDAAVVFKLYDHRDGREHYIYHGNDGTSMPWNDTAQLNYLLPQVREAVIQTILAVARRFSIIRFDAAMTLAKLHYQRLWFPQPGSAGAIPSRAEFGMTKEQFDQLMPTEFWREVVDRVAQEAPDTLLLAEAFWLMEGYFVRTLGMHRVYNSAFMNLLRNEENAKYRQIMKNTLEFEPEIIKRYVNFMNNPDERTAVDQFGKGDKYFGIAVLMSTLPGLPMFGHGQVEGFSEKYGMEYRRSYWNEQPDAYLVERHQREIFPLLHRRALFAGSDLFLLYDFFTDNGTVDENVYAYSNGLENERALVIYNNKFADTHGWVRTSVGFALKGGGGERAIVQRSLGEGLNLHHAPRLYCLYRDTITGLEYIRPSHELIAQGLPLSLHAYEYHVFMDFHEIADDERDSYRRVCEFLAGRGVPSVQGALRELVLQPVLQPLRQILNAGYFRYLIDSLPDNPEKKIPAGLMAEAEGKLTALMDGVEQFMGGAHHRDDLLLELRASLRLIFSLPLFDRQYPLPGSKKYHEIAGYLSSPPSNQEKTGWMVLFAWAFLHNLGALSGSAEPQAVTLDWYQEWSFGRILSGAAIELGCDIGQATQIGDALRILIEQQHWFSSSKKMTPAEMARGWFGNQDIQRYLEVNRFNEVLYYNQERFEAFIWWMAAVAMVEAALDSKAGPSLLVEQALLVGGLVQKMIDAEKKSSFQVARLLAEL